MVSTPTPNCQLSSGAHGWMRSLRTRRRSSSVTERPSSVRLISTAAGSTNEPWASADVELQMRFDPYSTLRDVSQVRFSATFWGTHRSCGSNSTKSPSPVCPSCPNGASPVASSPAQKLKPSASRLSCSVNVVWK